MIRILLAHQWKAFWRSRSAGKNLAVRILIGFFTLYILGSAILLGFSLHELIARGFPGQDVVAVFCGFVLYYFLSDLFIRFMLQDLPTLTIQPYLVQNIRRAQLIRFLNLRSMIHVINLFPLVLFVPFTLTTIRPVYGTAASFCFILAIVGLMLFNHFAILYIKRKSIVNSWWYVIFFLFIALLAAADYFQVFSVRLVSARLFTALLTYPVSCLLALFIAVLAYINNYRFLYKNLYLEDIGVKNRKKESSDYRFLEGFGLIGELMGIDLKLILRNKRPRSVVMISVLFLFYGFLLYKPQYIRENWWGLLLLGGIFITGLFVSSYGQFLFAWQSAHFDGMMAANLSIRTYIKSKFVLFTAVCTLLLLLSALYGFMSWKILVVQVAGYFYNVGLQSVIAVYFATRSYKAIDISKGTTFNYQGMGAEKWLYTLAVLLVPMLLYWPFALLINGLAGVIAIGTAGLISFLLQDRWVELLAREFRKRKHLILTGFREK